jgi:hypothetical protein
MVRTLWHNEKGTSRLDRNIGMVIMLHVVYVQARSIIMLHSEYEAVNDNIGVGEGSHKCTWAIWKNK